MDEATGAYISGISGAFQDLRQVASQLSGWMALREVGGGQSLADELVLKVARELLRCSREDIEQQRPTPEAEAHHVALQKAVVLLEGSFLTVGREASNVQAAWSELETAARLLPGFEMPAGFMAPASRSIH